MLRCFTPIPPGRRDESEDTQVELVQFDNSWKQEYFKAILFSIKSNVFENNKISIKAYYLDVVI